MRLKFVIYSVVQLSWLNTSASMIRVMTTNQRYSKQLIRTTTNVAHCRLTRSSARCSYYRINESHTLQVLWVLRSIRLHGQSYWIHTHDFLRTTVDTVPSYCSTRYATSFPPQFIAEGGKRRIRKF